MLDANAKLAALVGARICHDLVSPIGAVHNGLELLSLEQGQMSPEMALIADSVEHANGKLRFFRLAFGAGDCETPIPPRDISRMFGDMFSGSRTVIHWPVQSALPRGLTQSIFLLILCLDSALTRGGRITIGAKAGTYELRAEGTLYHDPNLWDALQDTDIASFAAATPAQVQFALLPYVMADNALTLDADFSARDRAKIILAPSDAQPRPK